MKWFERDSVQMGGRPSGGNLRGEGYSECVACGRDFFVWVIVADNRIQDVVVNVDRPGFVQDG